MSGQQPDLVPVFVVVAVRVSTGEQTPGLVHVPRNEAVQIVASRHGVPGEQPPRGYADGGADGRVIGAMVPRLAPPEPGM